MDTRIHVLCPIFHFGSCQFPSPPPDIPGVLASRTHSQPAALQWRHLPVCSCLHPRQSQEEQAFQENSFSLWWEVSLRVYGQSHLPSISRVSLPSLNFFSGLGMTSCCVNIGGLARVWCSPKPLWWAWPSSVMYWKQLHSVLVFMTRYERSGKVKRNGWKNYKKWKSDTQ